MSESQEFQTKAREHARNAAEKLRNAAKDIEDAYGSAPLPSDSLAVLNRFGSAVGTAQASLAHATHMHALAVLHGEREKTA